PYPVIAELPDLFDREAVVVALDFLEADDVRPTFLEIFEETRQPGADPVQIIGDDPHAADLAASARGLKAEADRAANWRRSDGEAGPAAATRGRIGIGDLKSRTAERFDIVDRPAPDEI